MKPVVYIRKSKQERARLAARRRAIIEILVIVHEFGPITIDEKFDSIAGIVDQVRMDEVKE